MQVLMMILLSFSMLKTDFALAETSRSFSVRAAKGGADTVFHFKNLKLSPNRLVFSLDAANGSSPKYFLELPDKNEVQISAQKILIQLQQQDSFRGFIYVASETDRTSTLQEPAALMHARKQIPILKRYALPINLGERCRTNELSAGFVNRTFEDGTLVLNFRGLNRGNCYKLSTAKILVESVPGGKPVFESAEHSFGIVMPQASWNWSVPVLSERPLARSRYRITVSLSSANAQTLSQTFEADLP